ncbi:MAG TPA: FMN-binding negative transcriptional regulator [Ilumatobacteraceae bacterium]|nr:FMN-binding negative transcriptional regulator [Ilumatobacteraceae bacterium]
MYVPAAFAETRPEVVAGFLAEHPMAQLVTMTADGLVATPLPMLYEPESAGMGSLVGHVARANKHWAEAITTVEALAIFTGPNAYVSPNWFPSKREHGKVVPTWNYESVHVRGAFVVHDDREWTRALVTRLTERHESNLAVPWAVTDAPPEYIEAMLGAIVGVEVRISSIQAKRKLSQNKSDADIAGAAAGLSAVGGDSARVAEAMRNP